MILEKNATAIFTDSGGIQKEAYFHKTPCITLRDETEWTELVKLGYNLLLSPQQPIHNLLSQTQAFIEQPFEFSEHLYGDGKTAERILEKLKQAF